MYHCLHPDTTQNQGTLPVYARRRKCVSSAAPAREDGSSPAPGTRQRPGTLKFEAAESFPWSWRRRDRPRRTMLIMTVLQRGGEDQDEAYRETSTLSPHLLYSAPPSSSTHTHARTHMNTPSPSSSFPPILPHTPLKRSPLPAALLSHLTPSSPHHPTHSLFYSLRYTLSSLFYELSIAAFIFSIKLISLVHFASVFIIISQSECSIYVGILHLITCGEGGRGGGTN